MQDVYFQSSTHPAEDFEIQMLDIHDFSSLISLINYKRTATSYLLLTS